LKPLEEGGMEAVATQIIPELISVNVDHKIREKAKKILTNCRPETYHSALQCLVNFDRRSELSKINIPTLLVAGEHDTQAPPTMMKRMSDEIANSRFCCLKGTGHLASLEQPETFNNVILEFISKHTSLPFTKSN
jgi:pimeloyl-ACP methyl ester carboxylesterase